MVAPFLSIKTPLIKEKPFFVLLQLDEEAEAEVEAVTVVAEEVADILLEVEEEVKGQKTLRKLLQEKTIQERKLSTVKHCIGVGNVVNG